MSCIYVLLTLQPCPSFVSCSILWWPWRTGIFYTRLVNILTVEDKLWQKSRKNDPLIWMKLGTLYKRVMRQSIMNLHLKGDSRRQWGQWKMSHHTHESQQLLLGALHHRNVMESGGRWQCMEATWLPETFNLPLPSLQPCCWNTVCQTRHTLNQGSLIHSIPCSKDLKNVCHLSHSKLYSANYHLEKLFQDSKK